MAKTTAVRNALNSGDSRAIGRLLLAHRAKVVKAQVARCKSASHQAVEEMVAGWSKKAGK